MKKSLIFSIGKLTGVLCLTLLLAGCFIQPYRFDITQGNPITAETINEIQEGMSEEQVRYMLGTPMLHDVFHLNRWDYIYFEKPGHGDPKRCHVAVYFDHGHVIKVTQDILPETVT